MLAASSVAGGGPLRGKQPWQAGIVADLERQCPAATAALQRCQVALLAFDQTRCAKETDEVLMRLLESSHDARRSRELPLVEVSKRCMCHPDEHRLCGGVAVVHQEKPEGIQAEKAQAQLRAHSGAERGLARARWPQEEHQRCVQGLLGLVVVCWPGRSDHLPGSREGCQKSWPDAKGAIAALASAWLGP
jgi:hypothetical protein